MFVLVAGLIMLTLVGFWIRVVHRCLKVLGSDRLRLKEVEMRLTDRAWEVLPRKTHLQFTWEGAREQEERLENWPHAAGPWRMALADQVIDWDWVRSGDNDVQIAFEVGGPGERKKLNLSLPLTPARQLKKWLQAHAQCFHQKVSVPQLGDLSDLSRSCPSNVAA